MGAEGGTGEVSRRACISGTDGSACCLPDVLAGNVVLKGLRLINRAYREDIVISSASPIHSEGMGGVIDVVEILGRVRLCRTDGIYVGADIRGAFLCGFFGYSACAEICNQNSAHCKSSCQ